MHTNQLMLALATLGMATYGLYSIAIGLIRITWLDFSLEWWAILWLIAGGTLLLFGSAFVRVSMPGGLALAVGGLLALQSISLHNDGYFYGQVFFLPQLTRAMFSALLITLAYCGWSLNTENDQC